MMVVPAAGRVVAVLVMMVIVIGVIVVVMVGLALIVLLVVTGIRRRAADRHAEFRRANPGSVDALARYRHPVEIERLDHPGQLVERCAGVEQRPE